MKKKGIKDRRISLTTKEKKDEQRRNGVLKLGRRGEMGNEDEESSGKSEGRVGDPSPGASPNGVAGKKT